MSVIRQRFSKNFFRYNSLGPGFNPTADFSITGPTSVDEGAEADFTVKAFGLNAGSTLQWTVVDNTNISDPNRYDAVNGDITMLSNYTAAFAVTVDADNTTAAGPQNYTVGILWNMQLAATKTITVNDTSQDPPAPPTLFADIDPSNIACYPGSGTLLTDLTGNGHNLTMVGNNVSVANGVLSIQSIGGNWAEFPTNTFPWTPAFTIHCWFQTVGLNPVGTLFGTQNTATPGTAGGWSPALYIGSDNKMYVSTFWHGGTTLGQHVANTTVTVNDGNWRLISVTYSGGTQTVYINGVQNGTPLSGLAQSVYGNPIYYFLGNGKTSNWPADPQNNPLSCNIGAFRFYTDAKNSTDVLAYYNSTKSTYPNSYTYIAYQSNTNSGANSIHIDSDPTTDVWAPTVPYGATVVADGIGTFTVTGVSAPGDQGNFWGNWWFSITPGTSLFPGGTKMTFSWTG